MIVSEKSALLVKTFYYMSEIFVHFLQRVRFQLQLFSTRQILNVILFATTDFEQVLTS